jgi:hypothetical protein
LIPQGQKLKPQSCLGFALQTERFKERFEAVAKAPIQVELFHDFYEP